MKTNAARLLDSFGITYEVRTYDVDPNDLSAASVARKIGLPLPQVFKTLLTRVDNEPVFAVVPGHAELNLRRLASLAGGHKAELMPLANVEPLTGFIRGGVTVLAAKRAFPVYVDSSLLEFDIVSISAGRRGEQLVLGSMDYVVAVTRAHGVAPFLGEISQEPEA